MNDSLDSGTLYDFNILDYTDSTMTTATSYLNLRGPKIWYAVLLQIQETLIVDWSLTHPENIQNSTDPRANISITARGGLVSGSGPSGDYASGIWACSTEVSDLLHQGIERAVAAAHKPEDISTGWESTFDQTILATGLGMLLGRPPLSVTQRSTTQVTRIPQGPLVTLLVLDITYALIGTYLMVAALIAVRKGRRVKDAQARLSTLGVIAESFESPAWGQDARDVDMLFAERRGESTRRIALIRQADGEGRKYKQVVVPKDYVKKVPIEGVSMTGRHVGSRKGEP
ncbi:MAG: hypothetical protein Q9218_007400 [Villophora microphyllina]